MASECHRLTLPFSLPSGAGMLSACYLSLSCLPGHSSSSPSFPSRKALCRRETPLAAAAGRTWRGPLGSVVRRAGWGRGALCSRLPVRPLTATGFPSLSGPASSLKGKTVSEAEKSSAAFLPTPASVTTMIHLKTGRQLP